MIKSKNPQIMFVFETKSQGDVFLKKSSLGKGWNIKAVDVIGLSGGLALIWRNDNDVRVSTLTSKFIPSRELFFIYGEPVEELRPIFYENII